MNKIGKRWGNRKPAIVLGLGVLLGAVLGCQGPVSPETPAAQSSTAAAAPVAQEKTPESQESVPPAEASTGELLASDEIVRRLKAAGVCSDVFVAKGPEKEIVVCEVSGSTSTIPTTVHLRQAEKIDQAISELKQDCSSCIYSRAGANWFVSSSVQADLELVQAAISGSDNKGSEWGDSPLALRTRSLAESDLLCKRLFPDPQAAALALGMTPDPSGGPVQGASYNSEPRADLVSVACAVPISADPMLKAFPVHIFWDAAESPGEDEALQGKCARVRTGNIDWDHTDKAEIIAAIDRVCD